MSCFAHVIYDRRILIKTKQKSETQRVMSKGGVQKEKYWEA
jgi:hypothetical protein